MNIKIESLLPIVTIICGTILICHFGSGVNAGCGYILMGLDIFSTQIKQWW